MARDVAESTNRISVFFLKKHKYLPQGESYKYGNIKWTRGNWQNDMNFRVYINNSRNELGEDGLIILLYIVTIRSSGVKTDMEFKIPLVTTKCNYGGRRYWFKCALYKNGKYCGRRVGVIYAVDKYFGCRFCAKIAYQAQFEKKRFRFSSVTEPDVEKAYSEVKRKYYRGNMTRKYKRYLRLSGKLEDAWIGIAGLLGK